MHRLVFGISGASGMPLAATVLTCLAGLDDPDIHLIISGHARQVMEAEGCGISQLTRLAARCYEPEDMAAPPASGSWPHDGMIVCPCSMSSLAAIATGYGTTLIHRCADVTIKERRPLILVIRETPLNRIHLRNMLAVHEAGATVMPFVPSFYTGDHSMCNAMRQFAGRILDQLRIPHALCSRWGE